MEVGMTANDNLKPDLSPDEIVEESILSQLKKEGLADDESIKKMKGKLASGSLKVEDWKLIFEVSIDKSNKMEGKPDEH